MRPRVVADLVALGRPCAARASGARSRPLADQEERGAHAGGRASASSTRGVQAGSGPSSKVSARRRPSRGPRHAQAGVSRCGSHAQPIQAAAPSASARAITSAAGAGASTASTMRSVASGRRTRRMRVAQVLEQVGLGQRALEAGGASSRARARRQRDAGAGGEALVARSWPGSEP